jgi:hypothetical protein
MPQAWPKQPLPYASALLAMLKLPIAIVNPAIAMLWKTAFLMIATSLLDDSTIVPRGGLHPRA